MEVKDLIIFIVIIITYNCEHSMSKGIDPEQLQEMPGVELEVVDWGTVVDETGVQNIKLFRWKYRGYVFEMTNYGATLVSVLMEDKYGKLDDIILGYDNIDGYLSDNNPYMGATVGRVANRVNKARFTIAGETFNIRSQSSDYSLHGGLRGFDKKVFNYLIKDRKVIFSYLSPDGEEGFPGEVVILVSCYVMSHPDQEFIGFVNKYTATASKPTIINLTNHAYFNLAGHDTGARGLYEQDLLVKGEYITETDSNSIPTGRFCAVKNTPYDLTKYKKIGDILKTVPGGGYDNNYCITDDFVKWTGTTPKPEPDYKLRFVAGLLHVKSGRIMEVHSTQLGVQIYTSNYFPKPGEQGVKPIIGKNGTHYTYHGGICFEAQNYPDAINHNNFPNTILRPWEEYVQETVFGFMVKPASDYETI